MADQMVLKCVRDHNRPFNTQSVSDLLATKGVKKAQAQRSLDALAAAGKLRCKEFGKAKLYYPLHDTNVLDKEEVANGMQKVATLQESVADITKTLRTKQRDLAALQNAMTVDQLKQKLADLQAKTASLEAKMAPMRTGTTISVEDSEALNKVFSTNMDAWSRRKRMFMDVWDVLGEGVDKPEKDLFEEIGVDTDADMKVSLKEFANLMPKRRR